MFVLLASSLSLIIQETENSEYFSITQIRLYMTDILILKHHLLLCQNKSEPSHAAHRIFMKIQELTKSIHILTLNLYNVKHS